jgi:hypothetical protein
LISNSICKITEGVADELQNAHVGFDGSFVFYLTSGESKWTATSRLLWL